MAEQSSWFPRMMLPALPPPRLTADVSETPGGEAYVVEIPVPGLRPDEIVIEVTIEGVTVSNQPREDGARSDQRYIPPEQGVFRVSRIFEFPMDLDTENVRATMDHGILRIHLPKAASGRRRVIQIAGSA